MISHEFITKVEEKEICEYIESDQIKLMPALQAKIFNWIKSFATSPDATRCKNRGKDWKE